jgi:hypothetical protein
VRSTPKTTRSAACPKAATSARIFVDDAVTIDAPASAIRACQRPVIERNPP